MNRFIGVLCLVLALVAQDDKALTDRVSEANKLYQDNNTEGALEIYLEELKTRPTNSHLWYNAGNAYFKQKKFGEAREAYINSMSFTDTLNMANVNYNIGNTYMLESKLDTAISYYKRALELNDTDEDAKYNLELARAILKEKSKKEKQQQNQQDQQQKQPEPSEYAKKLYEQAKALAKEYKFGEALAVMQQGLKQDPTVNAFKQFMDKLTSVSKILGGK